jgi:hypothetical protein
MPSDTYILTISEAGVSVPSNHASTHITGGSDQIPDATSTTSGLMSAAVYSEHVANNAKVSNIQHTGDVTDSNGVLTVNKIKGVDISSFANNSVLKVTTGGILAPAIATDYPTLNQSTTGNALTATSAGKATNLAGGSTGTLPYQTANDTTMMLPVGTSGTVLKSNGAAAPSWSAVEKSMLSTTLAAEITANTNKETNKVHTGDVLDANGALKVTGINNVSLSGLGSGILKINSSGIPSIATSSDLPPLTGNAATATYATSAGSATTAGTASNLSGGTAGSIPYQTTANSTTMLPAGSSGAVLKSNGAAPPSWSVVEKSMLSSSLAAEITANTNKETNKVHTGDVTDNNGALKVTGINNTSLVGLGTGLLKINSLGVPSIATSSDLPPLTGNAATATYATSAGSADKATNIAGGNVGSIPYQTAADTTGMIAASSSGFLKANGLASPSWSSISASDIGGTLPVSTGGTGATTLTGYVKGNGTNAMTASSTVPVGDISGTLPVGNGGTGAATLTGYVKGNGTSEMSASSTVPVGDISGTLPVDKGGTGVTTITGYLKGNGSGNFTSTATIPASDITGLPVVTVPSAGVVTSDGTSFSSVATLTVNKGGTGVTTSTGSGNNVLSNSPILVTPALGTPTSGTLTNCTGLPLDAGTTGNLPASRVSGLPSVLAGPARGQITLGIAGYSLSLSGSSTVISDSGTLDTSVSTNMGVGASNTFSLKNTSGATRVFRVYANVLVDNVTDDFSSDALAIKLYSGTAGSLAEVGGATAAVSWGVARCNISVSALISLADSEEVAVYFSEIANNTISEVNIFSALLSAEAVL